MLPGSSDRTNPSKEAVPGPSSTSSRTGTPEWDVASQFEKWTFSVTSALIERGSVKPLQLDDLMTLSEHDRPALLIDALKASYFTSTKFCFVPRLMVALFKAFSDDYLKVVFWTFVESASKIGILKP